LRGVSAAHEQSAARAMRAAAARRSIRCGEAVTCRGQSLGCAVPFSSDRQQAAQLLLACAGDGGGDGISPQTRSAWDHCGLQLRRAAWAARRFSCRSRPPAQTYGPARGRAAA
jgi:hypothetical protein